MIILFRSRVVIRRVFDRLTQWPCTKKRVFGGPLPAVHAALANADGAVFAVNLEQQPAVPEDGFDLFDFCWFHKLSALFAVFFKGSEVVLRRRFDQYY